MCSSTWKWSNVKRKSQNHERTQIPGLSLGEEDPSHNKRHVIFCDFFFLLEESLIPQPPQSPFSLSLTVTADVNEKSFQKFLMKFPAMIFDFLLNMLYQWLPPLWCKSLKSLINQFLNFSQSKLLYGNQAISFCFICPFCCLQAISIGFSSQCATGSLTTSWPIVMLAKIHTIIKRILNTPVLPTIPSIEYLGGVFAFLMIFNRSLLSKLSGYALRWK